MQTDPTDGASAFPDDPLGAWPEDPRLMFRGDLPGPPFPDVSDTDGLEDYAYQYMTAWLTHGVSPDNWWTLVEEARARLPAAEFSDWLHTAAEAFTRAAAGGGQIPAKLPRTAFWVLKVLSESPALLNVVDLAAELANEPDVRGGVSRYSLGPLMTELHARGWIAYPKGKKLGAEITPEGRAALRDGLHLL